MLSIEIMKEHFKELYDNVIFNSYEYKSQKLDIFRDFGTDSYTGFMVSILMSCTETVFYTMSVYYMAAKVTKTRWTLAGALVSTVAGIIASIVLTMLR